MYGFLSEKIRQPRAYFEKNGPSRDESEPAKKAMKGSAPAAGNSDVEAPAA
jgi:hypothetical protein